jgi:hypothetical protein
MAHTVNYLAIDLGAKRTTRFQETLTSVPFASGGMR